MQTTNPADGSNNAAGVIHKQFNANVPGADFIVQSSDGMVFYLHRKNLELYTDGAFPGLDSVNRSTAVGRMIRLEEPSSILEIAFQFVYPRRQPSLKDLDFQTISAVADAVEKYKIFAAMNLCEELLIGHLQDQPLPIFLHALRYRRVNLVNQSAMYLSRKPLFSVLDHIPPTLTKPWLRYQEVWKDMFEAQLRQLEGIPTPFLSDSCKFPNTNNSTNINNRTNTNNSTNNGSTRRRILVPAGGQEICLPCLCSMIAWVNLLQRMDKFSDLNAALTATIDPMGISHKYVFDIQAANLVGPFNELASRFDSGFCSSCSNRAQGSRYATKGCGAMKITAKRMLENIKKLPFFTTFLNEELDGEAVAN